ncbi:hypothetical protein PWG14_27680 [Chromobacterium amazonense]|uniref:DUF6933 domain-containing protein n=1 Tax=Chromobacterium amazonense TaxID=1382803 RepID=UPI00237DFA2E|nr:hypothetical protein [Chromobacterium amazonense]MDE1716251.1 hypothetical protein [Chromobacterium amazonense]
MLLFHCTKDASTALSSTRNGVTHSWVNDQPLPAGDTPWIWQLHAVKIMRQTVLVAMHSDSRFTMVFWGMKKGDGETLLLLFFERLANHLFWLAEDTGALDESGCETMFNRLMTTHHAFRFHTNSDRSVQAHINEVVQCCRNAVADNGCLPDNYEEAAGFEQYLNKIIRSAHGGDFFYPDEALLRACLRAFAGFHESQLRKVQEQMREARKQNFKQTLLQYVETKG